MYLKSEEARAGLEFFMQVEEQFDSTAVSEHCPSEMDSIGKASMKLSKSQKKREKKKAHKRKLSDLEGVDFLENRNVDVEKVEASTKPPSFILGGSNWNAPYPPLELRQKKPKRAKKSSQEPLTTIIDVPNRKRRKKQSKEPVFVLERIVDTERRVKKEKVDRLLAHIPVPEEANNSILRVPSLPGSPKSQKTATFVDGLVMSPEDLAIRKRRTEHLRGIPNEKDRAIQAELLNEHDKKRDNPNYDMSVHTKDLDENGKIKRSRFTSTEFKFLEDLPLEVQQEDFELIPKRKKQYKNKKPQRKQLVKKSNKSIKQSLPPSISSSGGQVTISQSRNGKLLCKVDTGTPLMIDVDAINRLTDARDARLAAAKVNARTPMPFQVESGQTLLHNLPIFKSMTRPFFVDTIDLVTPKKQVNVNEKGVINVE